MKIFFYINNSDVNVVDKSISQIYEFDGTLREACSVTDPEIMVESIINLTNINYLYIPEFNRYYYVKGLTAVRAGLWLFSCHVDVLMSFKASIRNCSAILARQENVYNLFLDDDKFLVDANRMLTNIEFERRLQPADNFVLTLAGGPK